MELLPKGGHMYMHDIKLSIPIVNCISHSFMYFTPPPSKVDIQCIEHRMGSRWIEFSRALTSVIPPRYFIPRRLVHLTSMALITCFFLTSISGGTSSFDHMFFSHFYKRWYISVDGSLIYINIKLAEKTLFMKMLTQEGLFKWSL